MCFRWRHRRPKNRRQFNDHMASGTHQVMSDTESSLHLTADYVQGYSWPLSRLAVARHPQLLEVHQRITSCLELQTESNKKASNLQEPAIGIGEIFGCLFHFFVLCLYIARNETKIVD